MPNPSDSAANRQNIVTVPKASGNMISVISTPDAVIELSFSPNGANVDRVDNDLVFSFEDGGKTTVSNFFVTEGKELPTMQMPDGALISGKELLLSLAPDMDITTAAGTGGQSVPSSGMNGYDDGAGDLIGGLDRLGALQFSEAASAKTYTSLANNGALAGVGVDAIANEISTSPEVAPFDSQYHTRLVITELNALNSYMIGIQGPDGALLQAANTSFRFGQDNAGYFSQPRLINGKLYFSLTDKGQAALANHEVFSENLYVEAGEHQYTINLFGSDNPYDYEKAEAHSGLTDTLVSEWVNHDGTITGDFSSTVLLGGSATNHISAYKLSGATVSNEHGDLEFTLFAPAEKVNKTEWIQDPNWVADPNNPFDYPNHIGQDVIRDKAVTALESGANGFHLSSDNSLTLNIDGAAGNDGTTTQALIKESSAASNITAGEDLTISVGSGNKIMGWTTEWKNRPQGASGTTTVSAGGNLSLDINTEGYAFYNQDVNKAFVFHSGKDMFLNFNSGMGAWGGSIGSINTRGALEFSAEGNLTMTSSGYVSSGGRSITITSEGKMSLDLNSLNAILANPEYDGPPSYNTVKSGAADDVIKIGALSSSNHTLGNIIETGAGADAVALNVMYVSGGKNIIRTGEGGDVITITGDMVVNNIANHTSGNSNRVMANEIEAGAGDDVLSITGDVGYRLSSGFQQKMYGENKIDMGKGDDIVEIHGNLSAYDQRDYYSGINFSVMKSKNTLLLGDGDDNLTIHGDVTFTNSYGASSQYGNFIDAGTGNDVVTLNGAFSDASLKSLNGNMGYDQLNIGSSEGVTFSTNSVKGFEHINMQNEGSDKFTINLTSLLNDNAIESQYNNSKALFIDVDASDTIALLGGTATMQGTVQQGETTYNAYQCADASGNELYILLNGGVLV